ncbi:PRC-barrel domain-containing protein [Saccharopolyspora taberi]|uniref:PRC-barrel domain-containing protein n=1 Tax=Saccharopolyspora taberi TaxID=60895 RepID=A0ABN3VMZ2_9PSEU
MIGQREALRLFGCEVFDPEGHRIGIVGQLFLDDRTEQPVWITVQTGLFGTNESFVPLRGAAFDGDTLTVAVRKAAVRHAPRVPLDDGDLPPKQEQALYLYYGIAYADDPRFG